MGGGAFFLKLLSLLGEASGLYGHRLVPPGLEAMEEVGEVRMVGLSLGLMKSPRERPVLDGVSSDKSRRTLLLLDPRLCPHQASWSARR